MKAIFDAVAEELNWHLLPFGLQILWRAGEGVSQGPAAEGSGMSCLGSPLSGYFEIELGVRVRCVHLQHLYFCLIN